jgi:6-phosphofructokinase 1
MIANYTSDEERLLLSAVVRSGEPDSSDPLLSFELAGPRSHVAYAPEEVRAAIVTCGGLCPGLNDVIRALVGCLWWRYGVRDILGVRYGYQGLSLNSSHPPLTLTPSEVKYIHHVGGSHLGSSRGGHPVGEMVDALEAWGITQLYCVGGDGTMRGATALAREAEARGLQLSVVGVPKTIDNDIPFVSRTFGFETAVSVAAEAIKAARVEASGAPHGVGVVKLMGRHAGFIAASAALNARASDLVLVPEQTLKLGEGEDRGVIPYIKQRLELHGEAVVVVAEGVGQGTLVHATGQDASGNAKLGDVGPALRDTLKSALPEANVRYIDPSYLIRATTARGADAMYCARLAEDAVHAAMSGRAELLVGLWGDEHVHVPFKLIEGRTKRLNLDEGLWRSLLDATGQPASWGEKG